MPFNHQGRRASVEAFCDQKAWEAFGRAGNLLNSIIEDTNVITNFMSYSKTLRSLANNLSLRNESKGLAHSTRGKK